MHLLGPAGVVGGVVGGVVLGFSTCGVVVAGVGAVVTTTCGFGAGGGGCVGRGDGAGGGLVGMTTGLGAAHGGWHTTGQGWAHWGGTTHCPHVGFWLAAVGLLVAVVPVGGSDP